MDHGQREATTKTELLKFLERFTPPARLTPEAAKAEFSGVVSAIVRHMDTDLEQSGYVERLHRAFAKLADTHETRAWPTQGEFVKAVKSVNSGRIVRDNNPHQMDEIAGNADRMRKNDPVSEWFVFGPRSEKMPPRELERYRSNLLRSMAEVYGSETGQSRARARYGDIVDRYAHIFAEVAKAELAMRRPQDGDDTPSMQSPKADNWQKPQIEGMENV